MKFSLYLFVYISCIGINVAAEPNSVPIPKAMAALGDSLTEAMLSDFSLEDHPNPWQILHIITLANSAPAEGSDRISSFRKFYASPNHSWATGEDESDIIASHFERLKVVNPQLKVSNYAVSGSESCEIKNQIDRLLEDEQKSGIRFDYITMLVGANDLRRENVEDMTSPVNYVGEIENNVRRLLDAEPDRRIFLVGLPDIFTVFEKSAKLVGYHVPLYTWNCSELRELIYGPLAIFRPQNPEAYEASKNVFRLYQKGVEALVVRLQDEYPLALIKTAQNYDSPRAIKKSLSIDCFHPSFWGQAQLAEVTWKKSFWPDL
jgi:lysophospholipase L1-like esterase